MAAMGVDCHAMPRWLTTPLAASAASFHPSKAAIATGFSSGPSTSLNLMTSPPPVSPRARAPDYSLRRPVPRVRYLWQPQFLWHIFVSGHKGVYTQEAYESACDHTNY